MFSGVNLHQGRIADRDGSTLVIAAPAELMRSLSEGDSVAVNGVCLTAVRLRQDAFGADLLAATLESTTLGSLPIGTAVNLEPALRAGDPLGGHLVQGHVDGTTTLLSRAELAAGSWSFSFGLPDWLSGCVVPKGSICVDGVSLTVQDLLADRFTVELIPHTLGHSTLGGLQPGAAVNLEADLIVKTVSVLLKQADLLRPTTEL